MLRISVYCIGNVAFDFSTSMSKSSVITGSYNAGRDLTPCLALSSQGPDNAWTWCPPPPVWFVGLKYICVSRNWDIVECLLVVFWPCLTHTGAIKRMIDSENITFKQTVLSKTSLAIKIKLHDQGCYVMICYRSLDINIAMDCCSYAALDRWLLPVVDFFPVLWLDHN